MNNVIIVAGGKGSRMAQELPKQFISIGGKPVLMHTIEAFYKFDKTIRIVIALSSSYRELWSELCKEHNFNTKHEIVNGGETRFHSVKNALAVIENGLVAIHDAARPFITSKLIKNSFDTAAKYKSSIPVLEMTDTLREISSENKSKIVDRVLYRTVQTPQVFDSCLLKKAYEVDFNTSFTDDASVVEYLGNEVHLIEGERQNIKITTPFDLELAKVLINN